MHLAACSETVLAIVPTVTCRGPLASVRPEFHKLTAIRGEVV